MEREGALKFSLAIILSVFLIFNAALVGLASRGQPLISAQDTLPIGIKWLILLVVALGFVGVSYWVHRAFLEAGIPPVATTWADFVIVAYAVMTMIALLFVGQSFWILYLFFLFMLFIFTAVVLWKLLSGLKSLIGWLVITLLLAVLAAIFVSTIWSA